MLLLLDKYKSNIKAPVLSVTTTRRFGLNHKGLSLWSSLCDLWGVWGSFAACGSSPQKETQRGDVSLYRAHIDTFRIWLFAIWCVAIKQLSSIWLCLTQIQSVCISAEVMALYDISVPLYNNGPQWNVFINSFEWVSLSHFMMVTCVGYLARKHHYIIWAHYMKWW